MADQRKKTVFHRILVPVTGTEADEETMRMACWIAKRDKSRVYAMYVITIKRSLPLEAEMLVETKRAEEILDRVEKVAADEDYQIETDLLQAREIAPTIIDEAVERKIDLILMGVKYQRRFGQFSLGNIVPYIIKNAPCQVMLYSLVTKMQEST
jgi:nucleotide-binding universal stress UspA family protein